MFSDFREIRYKASIVSYETQELFDVFIILWKFFYDLYLFGIQFHSIFTNYVSDVIYFFS